MLVTLMLDHTHRAAFAWMYSVVVFARTILYLHALAVTSASAPVYCQMYFFSMWEYGVTVKLLVVGAESESSWDAILLLLSYLTISITITSLTKKNYNNKIIKSSCPCPLCLHL